MFCLLLPRAAVATALTPGDALDEGTAASDAALVPDLHPNMANATAAPVNSAFVFIPGILVLLQKGLRYARILAQSPHRKPEESARNRQMSLDVALCRLPSRRPARAAVTS
jgi:hypothetical protein